MRPGSKKDDPARSEAPYEPSSIALGLERIGLISLRFPIVSTLLLILLSIVVVFFLGFFAKMVFLG